VTPGKRKAPEGTGADAITRPIQPPTRIDQDADAQKLTLWAYAIPAHPLHPAEAHLRLVANARPERSHWWIHMIRAHQAVCTWCTRCDGEAAA
jgi:hypothetical protein